MGGLFSLASPWWLLGLLVVAAVAAGYVVNELRRRKRTLRFANTPVLDQVSPKSRDRWKHVPIALLCVGLLLLTIALAGPTAMRKVPRNRATVMLVVDVSLSMEAKDVSPDRLSAAKAAAKQFADELTPGINLGVISFAGTANLLVSPTPDRALARAAIDNLQLAQRTATGEGIYAAIQAIENINSVLGGDKTAPPARIVLESDGKQTVPNNLDDPRGAYTAAKEAKKKGIPVSTISFGTLNGVVSIGGQQIGVPVDDSSLKQIADLSGGQFFSASSLGDLNKAYGSLKDEIGYEEQRGDNSRVWMLWGTLLVAVGVAAAVGLNRRLP
ncbi:VWA domain-containing protein [Tsukamurella sp. 8F]|uniref:VWA domain-containing protein n=1 Tax=unclassified Tsukamurella TaxID=2633480 RepID=UPI0023B9BA4C|nr:MULTISPECIES: VWA domain-containing protein [unclassified Tsukamurella]MDF0529258.1 VWA domain-containing protein [Tsukamurella sp. 8J]MDF0586905.1 VWA domain-containing protein [Tsukamurella sp. 8F]